MLVEQAIRQMYLVPDRWIRVDWIGRIPRGVDIRFAVHAGRRGKKAAGWTIRCLTVHESKISDFDGGGLVLHTSDHPAARQYLGPWADLRWLRSSNQAAILSTLYKAHIDATDDWIPFDRYVFPEMPYRRGFDVHSREQFSCRGPAFLIRGYAKALRMSGEKIQTIPLKGGKPKTGWPKVLHFGTSYVIAADIVVAVDNATRSG
jgi:hypothetical protein